MRAVTFIMRAALPLLVALGMAQGALAQDEEATMDAFAVVRGKGAGFHAGTNLGSFVGLLDGPLFVESLEGPVPAGAIVCSASMELKVADRAHTASGHCRITAEDGAQVYGRWTCSGYFLVGCRGDFTLTGGSGRFAGITGGGPMVMRTSVGKVTGNMDIGQELDVQGIVFWRGFKYRMP